MKFIIETITGRKGVKNFDDLNEYVDFMTKNGHKIVSIQESELPYSDKPVKLPKVSTSKGWEQLDGSAFGDIGDKPEKGECLLPSGNQGVFKNNASFEFSKSSESEDKQEAPKTEEASDLPKFKYEDESEKTEEVKEESDDSEKEESKEDKEEKKEIKEGIMDVLKAGYKKLTGAPEEKEIPELVNEYLVYAFMDICDKVSFENNETYQRIVKLLTKADSKFAQFAGAIRTFIANATATFQMPLERVNQLASKLVQMGVDKEIVNKARETFMSEEMNNEEVSENFDAEIAEALRIAGVELTESEDDMEENVDNPEDGEMDEKSGKEKLFEEEPLDEAPMSDEEFDSLEDGDKVNWDLDRVDGNGTLSKDENGKYKFKRDSDGGQMSDLKPDYIKGYFSKGEKEPMDKDSLEYAEFQVQAWEEEKEMAEYDDFAYSNGRMKDIEDSLRYWKKEVENRTEKKSDSLNGDEEILDETKPARYNQHLGKEKSFANISASRSNDEFEKPGMEKEKQKQSEENNRKTEQLKKDIKDLGLSYIKTYGAWRDEGPVTQEESFLIPNITKEQALELGKKYGQYSVIFKEEGEDTAYMYVTLDNEDFGKKDMEFDMSGDAKFSQVKQKDDELAPYSGYTGLKPSGKGYNLSYKVK